jgi:caffeoyl-CoA O-methyltransferase
MDILARPVHEYLDRLIPDDDPVRREMEEYARANRFPIVGPQVGRLLWQLAALRRPALIFELGSGFGYSAYWLLRGAPAARVVCTERDGGNIRRGKQWLRRARLLNRVEWLQGDAVEALAGRRRKYDMILNDVDKEHYPGVFPLALARLKARGLLITDNVLWSGRVADVQADDESTWAIREYNRLMFNTPGVFSTIVPIRDGVGITMKKGGQTG